MIIEDSFKDQVQFALKIKCDELNFQGLHVNKEDVWVCLKEFTWKNKNKVIQINEIVNDIFKFSQNDYLDYLSFIAITNANKSTLKSLISEL